jgi:hypothetical protein
MSTQIGSLLSPVIAKAVHDPNFRSQFLTSPKATLRSMSIPIPDTQTVTVMESKEGQVIFVLPILNDELIETLQASIASVHPQRSVRSRILIKAAQDPSYKAELLENPETVLRREGMLIPDSAELTVLENSNQHLYTVLPHVHAHP